MLMSANSYEPDQGQQNISLDLNSMDVFLKEVIETVNFGKKSVTTKQHGK